MSRLRIFLSAVSSEFTSARDAVFKALEKRGFEVTYQEKLTQRFDTDRTLDKVYAYFQECDLIIYIVGQRSGDFPPTIAAGTYAHLLPEGWTRASYTQWEYFFANALRADGKPRHRLFFFAAELFKPEQPTGKGEDGASQATFLDHLKRIEGQDRDTFTSEHHLLSLLKDQSWFQQALPHQPTNLPYPSLGNLFVGRDAFMKQLRNSIEAHPQSVIKPRHAIHGLGGIGKTRLATEYALQHKDQYSALLFVIAETPEALRRNLAVLCGPLVLDLPEQNANEEERKVAATLAWLQQHEGWFLLVDNVDTPEAVAEAERLLGRLSNGHVVYTSRITNWAGHVQSLELDVLDQAVSLHFILDRTAHRRRKEPNDEEQATLIAQDVDGLALALEQACAYINAQRLSLADYRNHWQQKHDAVMNWYDPAVMKYPKSVAITWQTSMDQLSADAKQLLMRLAWLSPETIPESLLDVKAGGDDTLDARVALAELEKYSLVSRSHEGPVFSVHRLVQDVVVGQQLQEENLAASIKATVWMCDALDGDPQDVRRYRATEALFPHALSVCNWAEGLGVCGPIPFLMMHISAYLMYYRVRYHDAEVLLRRALTLNRKCYGKEHADTLGCMNNLAQLLKITGQFEEAELFLREIIAVVPAESGGDNCRLSGFLSNLGTLLLETDRAKEAAVMLERALAIAQRCEGGQSESVARCAHNLAEALSMEDELELAEKYARLALSIVEPSFGNDHPHVASVLMCLARILNQPGKRFEAEACLRRALSIKTAHLPVHHPDIAVVQNNLGEFLWQDGRSEEALQLIRAHLVSLLAVGGKSGRPHPYAVRGKATYTRLLLFLGRTEAEIAAELGSMEEESFAVSWS